MLSCVCGWPVVFFGHPHAPSTVAASPFGVWHSKSQGHLQMHPQTGQRRTDDAQKYVNSNCPRALASPCIRLLIALRNLRWCGCSIQHTVFFLCFLLGFSNRFPFWVLSQPHSFSSRFPEYLEHTRGLDTLSRSIGHSRCLPTKAQDHVLLHCKSSNAV